MTLILPLCIPLLVIAFGALSPTTAGAQALHVPRVEVGGEAGVLVAIGEGVVLRPLVGPRLTFNISQRDAIEIAADTLAPADSRTFGFYFLQYKRTTRRTTRRQFSWSGLSPFFTVGTGGYYSSGELSRLNIAAVGGGFDQGLNRRASFRLEGSGFVSVQRDGFLAFRILAGVSVPIGGYRASSIKY